MHCPSTPPEIDQEETDDNGQGAHDPERRVRDGGQFAQVGLEFIREGQVGEAFDDEDHPHNAEKIFHDRSGCPFRRFIFRFVPQPVHFGEC